MTTDVLKALTSRRIVPVAVVDDAGDAVPLAAAVREAGLNAIEVTLRTDAAFEVIRAIRAAFPDMVVGAGTVLEPAQVAKAIEAGAVFGVAPGFQNGVIAEARRCGWPFIPGVMTPSEVERALVAGFRLLKFFPAEAAGGVEMLKALAGPYRHTGVRFIPLGGINQSNLSAYLALPIVAAVGGTWFLTPALISARDWAGITARAREAVAAAGAVG